MEVELDDHNNLSTSIQIGKEKSWQANGHQITTNDVVRESAKRKEEVWECSLSVRYTDSLDVLQIINNLELDHKISGFLSFFVLSKTKV